MKKSDLTKIAQSTSVELDKKVADLRKQMRDVLGNAGRAQVKNTRVMRILRRQLAIALTFVTKKHLEEASK